MAVVLRGVVGLGEELRRVGACHTLKISIFGCDLENTK
jgi:hypothetical protein